jgi:hypothetical protein
MAGKISRLIGYISEHTNVCNQFVYNSYGPDEPEANVTNVSMKDAYT